MITTISIVVLFLLAGYLLIRLDIVEKRVEEDVMYHHRNLKSNEDRLNARLEGFAKSIDSLNRRVTDGYKDTLDMFSDVRKILNELANIAGYEVTVGRVQHPDHTTCGCNRTRETLVLKPKVAKKVAVKRRR